MSDPEQRHYEPSPAVTVRRRGRGDLAVAAALAVALAYGTLDQGVFYADRFVTVLALVAAAVLVRLLAGQRRVAGWVLGCAAAWLGFAGWALLVAAGHGSVAAGLPAASVAGCLAAAAWCAGGLAAPGRRLLVAVVIALGLVAAGTGWLGVVLHLPPLALPSAGLWRAASTLTYANATAALLVVALLVGLAALPGSRRLLSPLVLAALLLGLAATMSRAGATSLLLGLAVAALAPDLRRRLVASWPALPAAGLGFAGLLPSFPDPVPTPGAVSTLTGQHLPVAVAGLAAGVAVLVVADRRPRWTWPVLAAGAAAGLLVAPRALATVADGRLTAASPERVDLVRVALTQFRCAPLAGVGPGRLELAYLDHGGVPVLAQFVHQEYLQLATETGLVGLALVLAGTAALAGAAWHRRGRPPAPGPVAALAVLAAFAAHSAFDFLWHIPVLPLLAVLAVLVLVPTPVPGTVPGTAPGTAPEQEIP